MGSSIEYAMDGGTGRGYLAEPPFPGPAVMVIQEWWGLVPHIREICDRFTTEGFIALAPDLYDGASTTEPDEAKKLKMSLNIDAAARHLDGAVAFLAERSSSGAVGVTGFCMGGGLSLVVGARSDVRAVVPFYGVPAEDPGYGNISGAVLGHYAEHDRWTEDDIDAVFAAIRAGGAEATAYLYAGTNHAFFNDTRPTYDEAAAALAWTRTIEHLRKHLA